MAGLLDNINNPWMALGAGLLNAGGPHLNPSQANLGRGMMGGLNAIQQQQQMKLREQILQQQQDSNAMKQEAALLQAEQAKEERQRVTEGRGLLMQGINTKSPEMIYRGALAMDAPPAMVKGLIEQMGLSPGGGSAWEGKAMDIQGINNRVEIEARQLPSGMSQEKRELWKNKRRVDLWTAIKAAQSSRVDKFGNEEKYGGVSFPEPQFPGVAPETAGAPAPTGGSVQQLPVQPIPGLTDGGAGGPSPRTLAPEERPVQEAASTLPPDVVIDATAEQGRPIFNDVGEADPELNRKAEAGREVFQAAEMTMERALEPYAQGETVPQDLVTGFFNMPSGTQIAVGRSGNKKVPILLWKGKQLTENQSKQLMQLTLARKALSQVRNLVENIDPDDWGVIARDFASQKGGASYVMRFGMQQLGMGTEQSKDEAELGARTEAVSNILLALYRGAQVGPLEQIRFDKQLPMIGQGRARFIGNLDQQDRNLDEAVRYFEGLTGKDFSSTAVPPKIEAARDPATGRPVVSSPSGTRRRKWGQR